MKRMTFIGRLPDDAQPGHQIMVEQFVSEADIVTTTFAVREKGWHSWGPPFDMERTS